MAVYSYILKCFSTWKDFLGIEKHEMFILSCEIKFSFGEFSSAEETNFLIWIISQKKQSVHSIGSSALQWVFCSSRRINKTLACTFFSIGSVSWTLTFFYTVGDHKVTVPPLNMAPLHLSLSLSIPSSEGSLVVGLWLCTTSEESLLSKCESISNTVSGIKAITFLEPHAAFNSLAKDMEWTL